MGAGLRQAGVGFRVASSGVIKLAWIMKIS